MIGIICQDDINIVGHSLFKNFRTALTNYLQVSMYDVNSVDELTNIDTLIIVDEHYIPHKQIWQNDFFINAINDKEIKVLIFNFEKIFNSQFPWNIEIQCFVNKINRKIQLVSDVKDAAILNTSVINKQLLSKDTFLAEPNKDKSDDILFLGQINEYYPTRSVILNELQQVSNTLKIVKTDRKYSYKEFIDILNGVRFILNPLGTGDFINLRFYEALSLDCIVIQQYTDEMEQWYPELNQPNVLKFKSVEDFKNMDFNTTNIYSNKYLEDYFNEINLKQIMHNI